MMQRIIQGLPPSFHESFFPNRRHLAALLKLAIQRFEGTIDSISAESGIPTGKSSGKVLPHLKYAHSMGLVGAPLPTDGLYRLELTPLGRTFCVEDPLLHEPLTQLIMHLMLSRPIGGASAWHVLFGRSRLALGLCASVDAATAFLSQELGNSSALPGPIFSTYREEISLARTGVLTVDKESFARQPLPSRPEYYWAFAFCLLTYWEQTASDARQLSLADLEARCGFLEVSGWNERQVDDFLVWTVEQGITGVDRQTGTPLIMRIKRSDELITQIYSDLL
ncbi:hypothetical protein [Paraburkholderia youngii]|uniref:DUF4007 family protein n=1 Tax=Paraburkholderia youngii TaxID=2782701 RepID=A0ABX2NXI6_9BURK|nr:hypothetical protein [Paraburkholderia youngii]NVI09247.1 hypothetical protein [Paraburkholderia youngii]